VLSVTVGAGVGAAQDGISFLPALFDHLSAAGVAASLYFVLVAVVSLSAVFAPKPTQRRAALQVLRLLLPRRRPAEPPGGQAPPKPERPTGDQ
jgi:hypothetical protein